MISRSPIVLAVLVVATTATGVPAQSLADAARKEQERRAKLQGASPQKPITEEELAATGQGGGTVSSPGGAVLTPRPADPSSRADGRRSMRSQPSAPSQVSAFSQVSAPSGSGEAYWRGRMAGARAAVTAVETQLKQLQDEATRLGTPRPGPRAAPCQAGVSVGGGMTAIQMLEASRRVQKTCGNDSEGHRQDKVYADIERARTRLSAAQKAVADLEEQARRAGAMPGWLR